MAKGCESKGKSGSAREGTDPRPPSRKHARWIVHRTLLTLANGSESGSRAVPTAILDYYQIPSAAVNRISKFSVGLLEKKRINGRLCGVGKPDCRPVIAQVAARLSHQRCLPLQQTVQRIEKAGEGRRYSVGPKDRSVLRIAQTAVEPRMRYSPLNNPRRTLASPLGGEWYP